MSYASAVLALAPTVYYQLQDSLADNSGNANAALVRGASTQEPAFATGIVDSSPRGLSFDGSNDYAYVPGLAYSSNKVSLALWVNLASLSGTQVLFETTTNYNTATAATAATFVAYSDGSNLQVAMASHSAFVTLGYDTWTFPLPATTDTLVTITFDRSITGTGRCKAYYDSTAQTASASSTRTDTSNFQTSDLYVMARGAGTLPLGGLIDDLAIFCGTVLSAGNVSTLFNAGPPGAQTVTVGTASETDTAETITPSVVGGPQSVSVGTAEETDTAGAVGGIFGQTIAVGTATETDTAGAVTQGGVTGTRAQGGLALLFRSAPPSQMIAVGTATETDTAGAVSMPANQTITVGTAVETDTALPVVIPTNQTVTVGTATETDTAPAVTLVLPGTIVVHPQGMVPGTAIGAYLRWEWRGPVAAKLNAGPGAVVQATTVSDDLTATFTLPVGEYVAYAEDYPARRLFFMVTDHD